MHVLICRPEPFASELQALLKSRRINADIWPALQITPPSDQTFQHFCEQLAPGDKVIATSQFVVSQSLAQAPDNVLNTLGHCDIFTVGAGTAKAFKKLGLQHIHHPKKADSENLLALPELQKVQGKRVWLLRGQNGRELISEILHQRGAEVRSVCCYERHYNTDQPTLLAALQQPLALILLTSIDSLRAFWAQVPEKLRSHVVKIPITVMSPRMRGLANELGFATIMELNTADNHALAAWIEGDKHG